MQQNLTGRRRSADGPSGSAAGGARRGRVSVAVAAALPPPVANGQWGVFSSPSYFPPPPYIHVCVYVHPASSQLPLRRLFLKNIHTSTPAVVTAATRLPRHLSLYHCCNAAQTTWHSPN